MGVTQQISSHEMSRVMKSAVKGVLCTVIYNMDPQVMLPMICETGILTVDGNDPYYGKLNNMIRHGREDNSVINHTLLDYLFTRHKWWIVFITVCQQCGYHGVIEAIEGKLTTTEKSELHRQIQRSTRQPSIEGRAERHSLSHSHRPPGVRQHSCELSLVPPTMATPPSQRTDPAQGNIPSNTGRSPGPLNELPPPHMQTHIRSSQSSRDRKPEGPQGLSLSDSRRQFEKRSSDSNVLDETLAKASTRTTDPTPGNIQLKGGQMDVEYQNTEMNSNIGRSPGGLIDDEKKINITKEYIHFAPKTEGTDTNNLSENAPYNSKEVKTNVGTVSNIGLNIPVPDKNAVGSNLTGDESNMVKVRNILSLENPKIQNQREDDMDTSVVTDDVTNKWIYPNIRYDNGEGRDDDNGKQDSPAMDGSDTVPYVSSLIIQTQLGQQRKRHGTAFDQEQVIVEYESREKESLEADPPEKEHRHDVEGRYHNSEETYRKESQSVNSQHTNTRCDHQPKVMNTERPNPEFSASAETRADSDVPCVSGPDHVSENAYLVGNIPNFGLLGDAAFETTIQGGDISADWIEEETSQNAVSDSPGDDALPTVDNGSNPTNPTKVMSEKRRSSANTDKVTSNALQQACSPLRETSGGSVYLSPYYSPRSSYPQAADYTHIPPPAHILSLSDTSEPSPIHEKLAKRALKQKTEGASTVKPR
ncbi:uncharacterized protein LOC124281915 [Haliotis rubra]|uniref:uncharacterized protein LOC124281915 n=1 Tax=Haliotis rubra TaxID=36100 RepID=UPI001EE4F8DD|nr:uncharacterized protein LOC124281915 [Haliotis rubra]